MLRGKIYKDVRVTNSNANVVASGVRAKTYCHPGFYRDLVETTSLEKSQRYQCSTIRHLKLQGENQDTLPPDCYEVERLVASRRDCKVIQ